MGQGIFKAVFWNLTLIFTSFNEGRSFDPIFISRQRDSVSAVWWVWEAAIAEGCVLDTWLLTPRLVDSTLLGSAVARLAGEAVVLLVLLRWRWGSLRILYSRICGSQYVSLCHSMRWMTVPHLNNNLYKDSFAKQNTTECVESSAVTSPLLLTPQLHDTELGTRTFM